MTDADLHRARTLAVRPGAWGLWWRYGLSVLWWLGALGMGLLMFTMASQVEASFPLSTTHRVILFGQDLLLGLVMLLLIRHRHRYPLVVAWMFCIAATFSSSGAMAATWAFVHLCTRRRWREVVPLFAANVIFGLLGDFVQSVMWQQTRPAGLLELLVYYGVITIFGALGMAAAAAIGFYVGARRDLMASLVERAETAEREQELRVLRGQAEERNRIAREMHDVLAHRLSLVSMHAGALAYRDNLSAEETRQIAQVIQSNAHASLTELRGVLGQLRTEQDASLPPEKPQPTLTDIDALVEEARAAGTRVEVRDHIEHRELLPTLIGRHAYRVLQEALTNARKHAPAAKVFLELEGAPGQGLTLVSRNHVASGAPEVPGAGVGLVGLAERAQVTGGRIEHGITDDGDFELKVWLPW